LRQFMFQTVYPQSLQRAGEQRVRHVITNLMQYFLVHPEEMSDDLPAVGGHLASPTADLVPAAPSGAEAPGADRAATGAEGGAGADRLERVQAVTDYISGMTDRYAITRYRELFEPRSWAGT
jgi:dGTPase